jgi:hypothetical protein
VIRHDLWILLAYVVATVGGKHAIDFALTRLVSVDDQVAIDTFRRHGLRNGGATIGMLERCLVLTFVLAGNYGAIGLILAAKGLLRYPEIKDTQDQKMAEYILVGTMLSLIWAVVVGLLAQRFGPGVMIGG